MIIERYGVKLIRVKEEHLELIRYWRNSEKIKRVMEYREHITKVMQLKWFHTLNPFTDFYFVIEHKEDLVGLIHASKINWSERNAQSGLFIWDDNFLGSPVPLMASINLLEVFMNCLKINNIEAKVKHDNINALTYNKFLGFKEKQNSLSHSDFLKISVTTSDYLIAEKQIKSYLDTADEIMSILIERPLLKELEKKSETFSSEWKNINLELID